MSSGEKVDLQYYVGGPRVDRGSRAAYCVVCMYPEGEREKSMSGHGPPELHLQETGQDERAKALGCRCATAAGTVTWGGPDS